MGDCGDVPLAVYQHRLAESDAKLPMIIFVIETRECFKVVGNARLMQRAYDDYNVGLLKIGGHTPLPAVPAEVRSIKDMATVARELQRKFHRVRVSLSDDGQVARAHLPTDGGFADYSG